MLGCTVITIYIKITKGVMILSTICQTIFAFDYLFVVKGTIVDRSEYTAIPEREIERGSMHEDTDCKMC